MANVGDIVQFVRTGRLQRGTVKEVLTAGSPDRQQVHLVIAVDDGGVYDSDLTILNSDCAPVSYKIVHSTKDEVEAVILYRRLCDFTLLSDYKMTLETVWERSKHGSSSPSYEIRVTKSTEFYTVTWDKISSAVSDMVAVIHSFGTYSKRSQEIEEEINGRPPKRQTFTGFSIENASMMTLQDLLLMTANDFYAAKKADRECSKLEAALDAVIAEIESRTEEKFDVGLKGRILAYVQHNDEVQSRNASQYDYGYRRDTDPWSLSHFDSRNLEELIARRD